MRTLAKKRESHAGQDKADNVIAAVDENQASAPSLEEVIGRERGHDPEQADAGAEHDRKPEAGVLADVETKRPRGEEPQHERDAVGFRWIEAGGHLLAAE